MIRLAALALVVFLAACSTPEAIAPTAVPGPRGAFAPTPATGVQGERPAAAVAAPSPQVVQARPIKIGVQPGMAMAPFLIAQARGYFNQEALQVQVVTFNNDAEVIPALASGQIDAALAGPSASLVTAVARGTNIKIVASDGTIKPHRNLASIVARKDLAPASGAFDLKNLTPPIRAAAAAEGTLGHAVVLMVAKDAGFKATDVTMSYMAPADMSAALQSKQIDLASSVEPYVTLAVQQGSAARWHEMNDDFPDLPYSTVLFGPNFTDKDPEGGLRFLKAYLAGTREFEDAFARQHNRDVVVNMLVDPMQTPLPLLDAIRSGGGTPYFETNGAVWIDPLQSAVDVWVETGLVEPWFDINRLVDPAPARLAVSQSGEYR